MCLLSYFPANIQPDTEALTCGARCNSDGHGYAILVPGEDEIRVGKGMNAAEVIAEFVALRAQYPHGPALFHSRLTTHGETSVDNCHPFVVNSDPRTVVAHNGILPTDARPKMIGTRVTMLLTKDGTPYESRTAVWDDRSDTRILADDLLMTRWSTLDSRRTRKRLTHWLGTGNKILVLTTDPTYQRNAYLFNGELGIWTKGGVWHSNTSFRGSRGGSSGPYSWSSAWTGSGSYQFGRASVLDHPDWDGEDIYEGEWHHGWVQDDRGVWIPSTADRWRNEGTGGSQEDPASWPVTLGGTRKAPGAATGSSWIDFVTCDICQVRSVDPDTGLCLGCFTCNDCVDYVGDCHCYGAPRQSSFMWSELFAALCDGKSAAKIRKLTRDYRRVCASFQATADAQAKAEARRETAAKGPSKELAVVVEATADTVKVSTH